MLLNTILIVRNVSLGHIKVNDDIEFCTVQLENGKYQIENVKGNVELIKVVAKHYDVNIYNGILCLWDCKRSDRYDFYIKTETKLQEVIVYHLQLDYKSCFALKLLQFYTKNIIIADRGIFKCYIKKTDYQFIEVHIANPDKIIINDKKEDYQCLVELKKEDMTVTLTFTFD
uniref:Uncharacterized protein n=1 Tax=Panagrolaimus sp. ES5 TaxID=591445 RepID=A0AC34F1P2_9BILA